MPAGAPPRVRGLNVRSFKGTIQKLTECCQTAEDQNRGKLYVYGGIHPKDPDGVASNDFYVCDTEKMEYTNLTDSLIYTTPGDPFSVEGHTRRRKRLPSLHVPGLAFTEIRGLPVVLLFGGHDFERDETSSNLIAINILHLEWFYITFEPLQNTTRIAPRFRPTVVALNERLYIFGGHPSYNNGPSHDDSSEDEPRQTTSHRSYSIAAFQPGTWRWKWIVADEPYPNGLRQTFRNGVVVHGGQAILLGPGNLGNEDINFVKNNFYYFIPRRRTFERLRPTGPRLPPDVKWYYMRSYDPDALQKERAYERTIPSAIICTWIPDTKHPGELTVEGWRLFLPPDEPERMECLGIQAEVSRLDLNVHRFALVGKRMFIMGQGGEPVDGEAMCDTYVEFCVEE